MGPEATEVVACPACGAKRALQISLFKCNTCGREARFEVVALGLEEPHGDVKKRFGAATRDSPN